MRSVPGAIATGLDDARSRLMRWRIGQTQSLPLLVLTPCATLDRQIDGLVYELYDLTPEEIAIVEGSGQ